MQSRVRKAIGVTAGAAALALTCGTAAMAEVSTTPALSAITISGVGSNTTQAVMNQLMSQYNGLVKTGKNVVYPGVAQNFNATGTATIDAKSSAACQNLARPNGSGAGISALLADTNGCYNYARSSRVKATNGTENSLAFFKYAKDAVTWATNSTSTVAPATLTLPQLNDIYDCTDTFWNQVIPTLPHLPIKAYLPQSGSGTRSFFLGAIGLANPGACVNQSFEENSGVNVVANAGADKDQIIAVYSTADWIAQHNGVVQDLRTGLGLRQINKLKPYNTNASTGALKLNTKFAPAFVRDVFNVVKKNADGSVPANLVKIFGPKGTKTGYLCTQTKVITQYGFAAEPAGQCGVQS